MEKNAELESTREAVALFKDEHALQAAIDELLVSGFDRAELSLLATEETLRATFGDRFKMSAELEDLEGVPRSCYCSPSCETKSPNDALGVRYGSKADTRLTSAMGGKRTLD